MWMIDERSNEMKLLIIDDDEREIIAQLVRQITKKSAQLEATQEKVYGKPQSSLYQGVTR